MMNVPFKEKAVPRSKAFTPKKKVSNSLKSSNDRRCQEILSNEMDPEDWIEWEPIWRVVKWIQSSREGNCEFIKHSSPTKKVVIWDDFNFNVDASRNDEEATVNKAREEAPINQIWIDEVLVRSTLFTCWNAWSDTVNELSFEPDSNTKVVAFGKQREPTWIWVKLEAPVTVNSSVP